VCSSLVITQLAYHNARLKKFKVCQDVLWVEIFQFVFTILLFNTPWKDKQIYVTCQRNIEVFLLSQFDTELLPRVFVCVRACVCAHVFVCVCLRLSDLSAYSPWIHRRRNSVWSGFSKTSRKHRCDHQHVVGKNSLKGPELVCPREL
jgi:hypothetical protein